MRQQETVTTIRPVAGFAARPGSTANQAASGGDRREAFAYEDAGAWSRFEGEGGAEAPETVPPRGT